jgi:hypothetical protein
MTVPETIPTLAFGSGDDELEGQRVVRLPGHEDVETIVEARHRQRLSELLPIRGACERFSGGTMQPYPEALAAFIWGLKPDCMVTTVFAFNGSGSFSLSAEFVARDRDEKQATDAVAGLRHGFDAALAAAALPCRFADATGNDPTDWHSAWHAEILPPGVRLLHPHRASGSRPHFSPRLVAAKDVHQNSVTSWLRSLEWAPSHRLMRSFGAWRLHDVRYGLSSPFVLASSRLMSFAC